MYEPNIVPKTPEFHRIDKQTITKNGKNFRVALEIASENPATLEKFLETVSFLIPIEQCQMPMTVFEVGLYTEGGWSLFYDKDEEKTVNVKEKVPAIIPHLEKVKRNPSGAHK